MQYFLIDFDSTFIKTEGLEALADIVLKKNPKKQAILEQIKLLTNQGMEGKMPFNESLKQRIKLLNIRKQDLEQLTKHLKRNISNSILQNKDFFKKYKDNIYIISGGFKEFIVPIVKPFGIAEDHIFANTFIFDQKGHVIGFDETNPLAQENGKMKLVKSLNLKGEIAVLGDGYTDYKLKEFGIAQNFTAFTENVQRKIVVEKADAIAPTFDEFLYQNHLPSAVSYPKNRIKALLLENIDQDAVRTFEKEGYQVEYYEKSLPEQELITKIKDTTILGIRSRTNITPRVLAEAKKLITIGAFCIGTNQIDLPTAARHGIAVFNAPYSNTRSVVELIIGEIIMLMRGIFEKSKQLDQGIWDKSAKGSYEIRNKTLGIIGYGNIGTQLSILAEALGMHVLFYDTVEKLSLGNAQKCNTLDELLKKSDIITVHVDGNSHNQNLIGEKEFKLMKDGVLFLNASRGFVVDLKALEKYLTNNKVKGAAIDVFPQEPKSKDEKFVSPLQQLPNVILTPHIGGSTYEAQKNIAQFVSNKIIEYINVGNTYLSVNIPNIQLPNQGHSHRLLHLHNNVPGILAQINNCLAQNNTNILGQYLKTNENIGYVITDVDKKYDTKIINILKKIPDTIRFRVLY
jgi:D-3-phosphoglycerate dehydrogenase